MHRREKKLTEYQYLINVSQGAMGNVLFLQFLRQLYNKIAFFRLK